MIVKKSAVEKLAAFGRAKQIVSQPIVLSWVGDQRFVTDGPIPFVCLYLVGKMLFSLACVCLK